jgi:hypothetical protein
MSEQSHFEKLAAINVSDKIEKKNGLSYLSWAWAVDQLLRADPAASWVYGEPMLFGQTMMVTCTVTAFGKPMTMQLPVMDYRNKAIANPNAFDVNTAMQRCLVKAIALHGLGLYIYAGEDLPLDEHPQKAAITPTSGAWEALDPETQTWMTNLAMEVVAMLVKNDVDGAVGHIDSFDMAPDYAAAFQTRLDSKARATITAYRSIIRATTPEQLIDAWANVPKYAQSALLKYKDAKKAEIIG